MISWWKRRRRQRLQRQPFPASWEQILDANCSVWSLLSRDEKDKIRRTLQVLVAEKHWEGCNGLEFQEEMAVTISAQAALLVMGLPEEFYFDHVLSVLLYPSTYIARDVEQHGGLVVESDSFRLGEAWYRGPVILAWDDVLAGARGEQPGRNVVLHEFSHQIDMLNGREADAVPPIDDQAFLERWLQIVPEEFERLRLDCRQGTNFFDCYGATKPGEFFAVVTEFFFEAGPEMQTYHPELYDLWKTFYRQDPARREKRRASF